MLFQQIGKGLVGKLLNRCHAIAPKLRELVQRVVVEADELSHHMNPYALVKLRVVDSFRIREPVCLAVVAIEREISDGSHIQIHRGRCCAHAAVVYLSLYAKRRRRWQRQRWCDGGRCRYQ